MNIHYIELENFKSFRGIHKVGPFTSMTGIIGPNGCGKSNIVDALTFAFHIENARNNHPISSIISQQHKADQCSVEVVLQNKDTKFSFKKTQTRKKQLTFFINNKIVNQDEYIDQLRKYNIGPQSFMLQGETDKLIKKTPEELSEIIEKACGSIKFKQQYDDITKNIRDINDETMRIISEQKNLRKEDQKLKTISEQNEKYDALNQEIKQIEVKIEQANFFQIDSSLLDEMKTLKQNQKKLVDRKGEEAQFKHNIQQNTNKIKELQKSLVKKQQENEKVKDEIRKIVGKLEIEEEQLNKAKSFSENVELQKNLQKQIKDLNDNIAKLNVELKKEETKLAELSSQESQKNKFESKKIKENYEDYQEAVRLCNSKTLDLEKELKKLGNDLTSANSQLKVAVEAKQKQNTHIDDLESKISEAKTSAISKQGELAKKQEDAEQIKKNLDDLEKSRKDNIRKIEIIQKELSILLQNKLSLEYELESMEEIRNQDRVYRELDKIKGFYGQLTSLIRNSSHKSNDLAIKIALGSMLNCLVVDTPQTASLVNVALGSQGLSRDVMILSNLPNVGEDTLVRARLGNNGETLSSLVDVDDRCLKYEENPDLRRKIGETLKYLLRGKVVCETTEKAFQLRNRKIQEIYQIITKDGDIITSGSIQISSNDKEKYSKKDLGTQLNIQNLQKKIENEVKQIDKKMGELDALKNSDSEKRYNKLIEQKEQCKSSIALIEIEITGIQEKIKKLEEKKQSIRNISAKNLEVETLEKIVKEIEQRLENVQQNKAQKREEVYQPFCKKHKIDMKELVSQDAETLERIFKNIEKQQQKVQDIINQKNSNQEKLLNVQKQHEKYIENKKKYEDLKVNFDQNEKKNTKKEKEDENKKIQAEFNLIEKEIQQLTEENEKHYEQLISLPNQLTKEIIQIKHSIGQLIDKKETLWQECQMKQIDFQNSKKLSQMKDFGADSEEEDEDENKSQDKSDDTGDSESQDEKNIVKSLNKDFISSMKHYTQALSQLDDKKLSEYLTKFSEIQMLNYSLLFQDRSQFMKKKQKQTKDNQKSDSLLNQLLESVDINSLLAYQNRLVDDLEELKKKIEDYASKDLAEGLIGVSITSEDMKNKKDALKNRLSELLVEKKKAEDELKNVKNLRIEKFDGFYNEVKNSVKTYYAELTKLKGKDKGTAELTVSNDTEKYIGGINYICCPPKKQFTLNPEKDLSGGEKTLAQMALYLAIAKKSPFLILDESEAALDASNTQNVIETLKNQVQRQQKLIVSHNQVFYSVCESLVGATFNREQDSSFALSLDLRV